MTLFLWDGVTYYLKPGSINESLDFVSHCSHKETSIVFDCIISTSEDNNDHGVKEFLQTMKDRHSGERLVFVIDEDKISAFLEERGLR